MHGDVETLLSRQARETLPFFRQVLLYLDPFAFFKDATRGNAWQQELALQYNRAARWMLLPYIRRWITIAAALFLCIAPAEALAAKESLFYWPAAAFAVGCSIAITVAFCTLAAYLLLSAPSRRS
jgi:hypothetical protein